MTLVRVACASPERVFQRVHGGDRSPTSGPVYPVLLAYLRQLSKMEVPHSPAFTRWSLAIGLRMSAREEEVQRWALVAGERFQAI